MASPAGQFRPGRLILTFLGITLLLYGLVFLLPGAKTPKLGIDLQGGTRVTLQAKTSDGATPSRTQMNEARSIMERRVNGSGVVGAQVQVDGSSQLVVTVPGNADLQDLTRSAVMNIRPVLTYGIGVGAQVTTGSGTASGSRATSGSTAASGPATSGAATGSGSAAPSAPTTSAQVGNGAGTTVAPSSAAASSGHQLRAAPGAVATTAPSPPSVPSSSAAGPSPTPGSDAAGSGTVGSAAVGSGTVGSAAVGSDTAGSGAVGSGTAASTGASSAHFPVAGSDQKVPSQPAGTDATSWTAWETAVSTALQAGSITCAELGPYQGLDDASRPLLACDSDNVYAYLLDKTLIPGNQIDSASAGVSSQGAGWSVNVTFDSTGFATWSTYTTANVGKQTAFTLDGQVLSAPSIRQAITTTTTEVSGSFNQTSATALANSLKFGALPLFFSTDKTDKVSAELGLESLQAGLIAGGIGLLLVVLYCLLYYRLLGVITVLSLVLSFGVIYAVMVLLGRWIDLSLDISGIAGLIIAIGITADSFVVYFERLKDEVRDGRTFRSAVPRGWERAKRTILSSDFVTFLSAVILYVLAVGDVKGFAFTLGLSTVLDLLVVFLVTHPLVAMAAGSKVFMSPRYSGLGAVAAAGARHRAATARLTAKEA